ncbi:YdcF family protein [Candidatus Saccharibacteria bacterium]|nr:YdcF family protein [Candidatus Saccharibacteria bacterium]
MKLSEYKGRELTNEDIDKIVFSGIDDSGQSCNLALVFGHVMLTKERTQKAVEMYKSGRVKKLVFMGGGWGDSNTSDNHVPESHQMRAFAIELGVNPNDIMAEDKSTDTKSNILNTIDLVNLTSNDLVMLVTSEFHLKRCDAIIKKKLPGIQTILVKVPDGIHDRDNWFLNDMVFHDNGKYGSGKTLVVREAHALIDGAYAGELEDFDIVDT